MESPKIQGLVYYQKGLYQGRRVLLKESSYWQRCQEASVGDKYWKQACERVLGQTHYRVHASVA